MCRIDGADPSDFYSEKTRRARKEHRCEECGRKIAVGESHHYAFVVAEGLGDSYRTCAHCCAGQSWLSRECGGWIFGSVGEELQEHAYDYPEIAIPLRRLYLAMRRQWRYFDGSLMKVPSTPEATIAQTVHQ